MAAAARCLMRERWLSSAHLIRPCASVGVASFGDYKSKVNARIPQSGMSINEFMEKTKKSRRSPPRGKGARNAAARPTYVANEAIKFRRLLLINAEGKSEGEMSNFDALKFAKKAGLDLVVINDAPTPPICKLLKLRELVKKDKLTARAAKTVLKEVKFKSKIDEHDIQLKIRKALQFIENGNSVKIVVMKLFRDSNKDVAANAIMTRVLESLEHVIAPAGAPSQKGHTLNVVLNPLPKKK